jgi:hypothetical protein
MKRLWFTLAALSLALSAPTAAEASATAIADRHAESTRAHGFERFLRQYEAANTAFVNGDPSLWLAMTAERDPVSIFGGFGGLGEAGTDAVHRRYQLAAGAFQYSGEQIDFEYLVKDVRGRLAYTVAIERGEVLYAGHTELSPHVLRVTMLFRFDRGEWKIIHRHADTMIELELPTPPPPPTP